MEHNERFPAWLRVATAASLVAGLGALEAAFAQETGREERAGQMPAELPVAAASDLLGRTVRTTDAQDAGRIEYLMIDMESGRVSYAILAGSEPGQEGAPRETAGEEAGSRRTDGKELIAVPWTAFRTDTGPGDQLSIRVDANRLRNAPTIGEDRIGELTDRSKVTQIHEYYLVPAEEGEGEAREETREREPSESASQHPRILVAREVMSVLMPPAFETVNAMTGTTVDSADGKPVGEIDEVVIDPAHGYVAYLLLDRDGEWRSVPLGALDPSPADQKYRLNASMSQVERIAATPKKNLPTMVRMSDLERLYENYNLTPYWRKLERATEE